MVPPSVFLNLLKTSTAHRKSRDDMKNLVIAQPALITTIFNFGCEITDKNHHKAWWVMEHIFEENLLLLKPFLSQFAGIFPLVKSDSALRSITKIAWFIAQSPDIKLNDHQKDGIYNGLFNCLLDSDRAANAAYSMYALYVYGKNDHWIHDELKIILSRGFENQTPAYRAAAKNTLLKLNKKC